MANLGRSISAAIRAAPARLKSWVTGGEGSWRGPFMGFSELGNAFTLGHLEDGFQRNLMPHQGAVERFGPVYACVAILSQELSRIPVIHYRTLEDERRERVTNKAVARVMRKPNSYQTKSDFFLAMMRSLLLDGNAYAVAERNDRFEVSALHPVSPSDIWPYIADGQVFYRHGDQNVVDLAQLEKDQWFAQRDVLHIRLFCPRHPLVGESPITAALHPAAAGMQINAHTTAFFANMSRPSGILRYPGRLGATAPLQEEAIKRIKQKFMEITQHGSTGEPIVLQDNADFKPLTMSAIDADLVNSYKLTERQIAQTFRVPPFLLGDLEKASFQNVESLSRFFVQSSLGFYVDHFEDSLTSFFGLPPDEYVHFDVETALLRADLKERMGAYAQGVQNGVYAPNEVRRRENLPPVDDGDEPRVQQQLVPLSYGMNMQAPGENPAPAPEPEPEPAPTEEQQLAADIVATRAIAKAMAEAA